MPEHLEVRHGSVFVLGLGVGFAKHERTKSPTEETGKAIIVHRRGSEGLQTRQESVVNDIDEQKSANLKGNTIVGKHSGEVKPACPSSRESRLYFSGTVASIRGINAKVLEVIEDLFTTKRGTPNSAIFSITPSGTGYTCPIVHGFTCT